MPIMIRHAFMVSRRRLVSSSFLVLLTLLATVCLLLLILQLAADADERNKYAMWSRIELKFTGPLSVGRGEPNPFSIRFEVMFTSPDGRQYVVPGYYDGDGQGGIDGDVWTVRFSADQTGRWSYVSRSEHPLLDGHRGRFDVDGVPADAQGFWNWGRLQSVGSADSAIRYLKFRDGPYWLKAGCGAPENFLGHNRYFDTLTKRQAAVDYLAARGINSLNISTHSFGGDDQDVCPWLEATPGSEARFDVAKLRQWQELFEYMQTRGVVPYLVLKDESAWTCDDHQRYYRELIARFGYLPALTFNLSEEQNENNRPPQAQEYLRLLAKIDPYHHPGGFHSVNRPDNQNIKRHCWWNTYLSGGAWDCHVREPNDSPLSSWDDVWTQLGGTRVFMESLPFWEMQPHNELVGDGHASCLAKPGEYYALYIPAGGSVTVNLEKGKEYRVSWWNPSNGRDGAFQSTSIVAGGSRRLSTPGEGDWALRIAASESPWKEISHASNEAIFPTATWQSRQPHELGLDSEGLDWLARAIGGDGVVIRNGYLVKSWGNSAKRDDWASSSKPVISTLLLFAIHEGRLPSVDAPVHPWIHQRWPDQDLIAKDRSMTFRHLANMTSGYARAERPGTHWAYNDSAISLYRHALEEVLGQSLNEAAIERFAPLQLQDGDLFGSRDGAGIETSPRDLARLGWFWLNRGKWHDQQLLTESWFDQYCRVQVGRRLPRTRAPGEDYLNIGTFGGGTDLTELGPGLYGFNWWFNSLLKDRNGSRRFMPHLPSDAFHANGHWGGECMLMIPSLRIVVAARGDWDGIDLKNARYLMQAVQE